MTDLGFMRQIHLGQDERGFTLVELMVAAMVLVVGLLGAVKLLDGAHRTTSVTNARIGASNLARELVEYTRATDYNTLTNALLPRYLQARPNMPGGTSNPFQVERRGVTYTVTVSGCAYDDPKDGIGTHTADLTWCPSAAAGPTAPVETNPDDYRRVTLDVTWTSHGRNRTLTQSTLVVNPSGGLGPRINSLVVEPTAQITAGASGSTLSFTATTEPAVSVRWSVDAAGTSADAVPNGTGGTSWSINWNLGTYGVAPFVTDGVYTLSAQAFNSRGVPGEKRIITIPLNRSMPIQLSSFTGGHNNQFGGIVDLTWKASIERDVVGYRVDRQNGTGWVQVCPVSAAFTRRLSCSDTAPGTNGSVTYRVLALDRADVLNGGSALQDGAARTITVSGLGTRPPAPQSLTVTIENGYPVLRWTQPSAGVNFFRIYRDGTALANRYDTVPNTGVNEYTDGNPGTTAHTYYVSAVETTFNESGLSNRAP